jgi:hypothetical protein
MQVKIGEEFHLDLHTRSPLTQSDYTRSCINTNVLLKISTELLETCRGLKYTYYRINCASRFYLPELYEEVRSEKYKIRGHFTNNAHYLFTYTYILF